MSQGTNSISEVKNMSSSVLIRHSHINECQLHCEFISPKYSLQFLTNNLLLYNELKLSSQSTTFPPSDQVSAVSLVFWVSDGWYYSMRREYLSKRYTHSSPTVKYEIQLILVVVMAILTDLQVFKMMRLWYFAKLLVFSKKSIFRDFGTLQTSHYPAKKSY